MDRRHSLVIIDTDREYVKEIEEDIIRKYADKVDLQIITDPAYIEAFYAEKPEIDVLVVDEHDYTDAMKKLRVRQTFLMLQEIELEKSWPANVKVLVKYLPKEEVFQAIGDAFARMDLEEMGPKDREEQDPCVVAVYSPIGGCGKSLVTVGLARKLHMLDQRVLVVGCDDLQGFSFYLDDEQFADEQLADELREIGEDTYWTILQNTASEGFTYLKPFRRAPHALGVGRTQWRSFVALMREKHDFDFIVLDIGSRVDEAGRGLMEQADEVVLITEPNLLTMRKIQRLAGDDDMLPARKCLIFSNEYHMDGMRFAEDAIFDEMKAYPDWLKALEDPAFYRLALALLDTRKNGKPT